MCNTHADTCTHTAQHRATHVHVPCVLSCVSKCPRALVVNLALNSIISSLSPLSLSIRYMPGTCARVPRATWATSKQHGPWRPEAQRERAQRHARTRPSRRVAPTPPMQLGFRCTRFYTDCEPDLQCAKRHRAYTPGTHSLLLEARPATQNPSNVCLHCAPRFASKRTRGTPRRS